MPKVKVNGVNLNYVQMNSENKGACEDVVMIHGLAANLAFWGFHYAPIFSKQYKVTLFDLRGHGRSEMTQSGYSPCNLTTDLQLLLDKLGIRKAHFIAHSFGGIIALKLATLVPDRVASIIIADTHIAAVRNMQKNMRWKYGESIQPILRKNNILIDTNHPYFGYRLLAEIARLQLKKQELSADLKSLVSSFASRFEGRSAAQWLNLIDCVGAGDELMSDDLLSLEDLKKFTFPILAIYGELSQSMLTGKHLLNVWPHADFRCVRDGGHFFPITKPDNFIHFCEQFWKGALVNKYPRRKGDPIKSHFRRERIFENNGGWFFSTREKSQKGPYTDFHSAEKHLVEYIANAVANSADYKRDGQKCL